MKTIYGLPLAVLLGTVLNAWDPPKHAVPRRDATPSEIAEVFRLVSSRQEVARMAASHRLLDVHFTFRPGPSSVGYTVEYHWGEKGSSAWAGRNECQGFFVISSTFRFRVEETGSGVRRDGRARCNY